MAVVIVGGLITSTLLNLLVLPTLSLRFGRFDAAPQREPLTGRQDHRRTPASHGVSREELVLARAKG